MKVQGRRKIGRPKIRWFYKVKDDIKEKGLSADDVYDLLHGSVCHRTSTPHKSGNTMKEKKKILGTTLGLLRNKRGSNYL